MTTRFEGQPVTGDDVTGDRLRVVTSTFQHSPTGHGRWRVGAGFALIYLLFPALELIQSDRPWPLRALGLLTLVGFGLIYIFAVPFGMRSTDRRRLLIPLSMFALSWLLAPLIGPDLSVLWIFVGVAAAAMVSLVQTLIVALVLAVGMIGLSQAYGQDPIWELAITLVGVSMWMAGFVRNIKMNQDLREAREELATLAVAAERQRIARDLHDILGHSLTAITVKAALAGRLVERDPAAATVEIADVERLARETLADVRATASGIRDISLAAELAIAHAVLQAAGVVATLPQAVDDVDPAGREVFGFVVREAVTNVVRHSAATRCVVTVTPSSIEIRDNGPIAGAGTLRDTRRLPGSGLRGLAERLAAVGGNLTAGPVAGVGFVVRAEIGGQTTGVAHVGRISGGVE